MLRSEAEGKSTSSALRPADARRDKVGGQRAHLGNATISATILITGMLVFSGVGSLASERILGRSRTVLPGILLVIGFVLFGYPLARPDAWLDRHVSLRGAVAMNASSTRLFDLET